MATSGVNDSDRGEVVIYQPPGGAATLHVRLTGETLWLSLNQIAALFERDKSVISRHLRKVFSEGELERSSVVAFFATTAADGKTYQVEYFNLDAILSVGYRVNSRRGTQFRIWATGVLRSTWSEATRPMSAGSLSCAVRCAWSSTRWQEALSRRMRRPRSCGW